MLLGQLRAAVGLVLTCETLYLLSSNLHKPGPHGGAALVMRSVFLSCGGSLEVRVLRLISEGSSRSEWGVGGLGKAKLMGPVDGPLLRLSTRAVGVIFEMIRS